MYWIGVGFALFFGFILAWIALVSLVGVIALAVKFKKLTISVITFVAAAIVSAILQQPQPLVIWGVIVLGLLLTHNLDKTAGPARFN